MFLDCLKAFFMIMDFQRCNKRTSLVIKNYLSRKEPMPRVRKALSNWVKATRDVISINEMLGLASYLNVFMDDAKLVQNMRNIQSCDIYKRPRQASALIRYSHSQSPTTHPKSQSMPG